MFPTLVSLTIALSSPGQVGQAERKSPYPPQYEELDILCREADEVCRRLMQESTRVVKLCEEILDREGHDSFHKRLSILRDFVALADEAARYAAARRERFDRAYQRNPLKLARDDFEGSQKEIVRFRGASRYHIHSLICTYRWPWETAKERPFLNSQLMMTLARAAGMERDEKFYYRVAEVEMCATDTYRAVAGGVEALFKGLRKLPVLPPLPKSESSEKK